MAIKVANSSPGTIKVSVNETSSVQVSSPDNSVISVEPGITSAERSKLAGIEAGAKADQTLTGGTNINVIESGGDYTISLDSSIDLSGTLDVSGDATLDSNLTVAGDITVSDGGGAIFQTQSSADNINVRAQTVKFPGSFGVNISSTASGANATLKSNSGTVSLDGNDVTLTMDGGSSRKTKVYDGNSLFTQDRFVIEGLGTTTLYQASTSDSGAKLFEIKAAGTTPFALEHVQIGPDSGGYKLPPSDGSANTFLQTDGSGTVTFVAPTVSDLSDSSSVVVLTGAQTITGNKTFSGTTTLSGTNLISGSTVMTAGLTVSGSALTANAGLSVSGSSLLGAVSADSLATGVMNFKDGAANISTIQGDSANDDLQILSDGNVIIKIDQDNDETNQKLIVRNNADTEKFSVNEDGTVTVYGKIVSASNGDIDIEPNGTGDVLLGNFKFDADQSVGSGQNNYVLTYDDTSRKISLKEASSSVSNLSDLDDVNAITTDNHVVSYDSATSKFVGDGRLTTLYNQFRSGSNTNIYADGTTTTEGKLLLSNTGADLKVNITGLEITESSPGDIEFVVATDANGDTAFTALHIDGSTTANQADFLVKNGTSFKLDDGTYTQQLRASSGNTANTVVVMPSKNGTLATTGDLYSDSDADARIAAASIDDLSDVDTSTVAPTDGQALVWDNTNSKWEPGTVSGGGGGDVVDDTTPQLGGDLDVNSNKIVSTSNANIVLNPNGTGEVRLDKATGDAVLQVNHITNGNNSRLELTEGNGTFGGFFTYDSDRSYIGSINGSSDVNSIKINRPGDMEFLKAVKFVSPAVFEMTVDNDATNFPIELKDENSQTQVFYLKNSGVSDEVDMYLKGDSQITGNLEVQGKIISTSNGDIDIEPNGTGDVLLGNFKFDADQTVGASEDNYVLTYDNSTGKISLEASSGGGSSAWTTSGDDIYYDTGKVGIGVTSPAYNLDVADRIHVKTTGASGGTKVLIIGDGATTEKSQYGESIHIGYNGDWSKTRSDTITIGNDLSITNAQDGSSKPLLAIGNDITLGTVRKAILIGNEIGNSSQTDAGALVIGHGSAKGTGANQFIIGHGTATNASGSISNSALLGHGVAAASTNTSYSTVLSPSVGLTTATSLSRTTGIGTGLASGYSSSISHAILIGYGPAQDANNPNESVIIGTGQVGRYTNSNTIAIGHETGRSNNSYRVVVGSRSNVGTSGVTVGSQSGGTGSNSIAIGRYTGLGTGTNRVAIGYNSQGSSSNTSSGSVSVGHQSLKALTTGASNTAVGYQAGDAITTSASNTLVGYQAGTALTTGTGRNVCIGELAGDTLTTGLNNTIIGRAADSIAASSRAVVIGTSAISSADQTTIIGSAASGTAIYSVAIGDGAKGDGAVVIGYNAKASGTRNIVIGDVAGGTTLTGSYNVVIGRQAGQNLAGTKNVVIGYQAGQNETGSNKLYIDNSNSTTPLIYGEFDNDIVKVNGQLEVTEGITVNKTADTDFSYNGDVMYFGSGSTTQGELCYLNSSGGWTAADADATGTAGGVMLAIALGTDPDVDGMLLRGTFTLDHDPGTIGDELYVSTTAGDITATAPSGTGDIVRVVGYCLDSTNGQIYFNPSNDFIELA